MLIDCGAAAAAPKRARARETSIHKKEAEKVTVNAMRARRWLCAPPPSLLRRPLPSVQSSLRNCRRWWSLATLVRQQPTHVDLLLRAVRDAAASSDEWDIDFSAMAQRGGAAAMVVGCPSPAMSPSQLIRHVGAALAQELRAAPRRQRQVRRLRLTLPTPEAVLTVLRLATDTPLLSSVTSLELVVERGAVSAEQDSMGEGAGGGSEVAQLLRVLAAQSATLPAWVTLSVEAREGSSAGLFDSSNSINNISNTEAPLFPSSYASAGGRLWDDATVAALAELMQSKPWSSISLAYADFTSHCAARTRQKLWTACGTSCNTLVQLHLVRVRPVQELIRTGLLRRCAQLRSLDVGQTALEETAVVTLLEDLNAKGGVGGWWRLRHLGLSQCELSDAAVAVMAAQLRARHQDDAAKVTSNAEAAQATAHTGTCPHTALDDATPEEEATVPPLTSLDIAGARLSRTAVFDLASCLVRCTALQHLNTRHCRLTGDGVTHLAAALRNATGLRSWVLCLNRLTDDGVAALAKYGRHWLCLKEVDLTRCRLTSAAASSIAAALPSWDAVEVLRLVGNDLRCCPSTSSTASVDATTTKTTEDSTTGLFAYDPTFMKQHGSSGKVPTSYELERRDRAEGRRRFRGTEEFVTASATAAAAQAPLHTPLECLGEALSCCRALRQLDLSDCACTDVELHQLVRYFAGGPLQEVCLSANPLFSSVAGLDALVQLLSRTPQLVHLDLSFTGLGDLGLSMLCDGTAGSAEEGVLTRMTGLETLLLSSCTVHALGWESLTAALPRWPALQHISLHHNVVEDMALLHGFLHQLAVSAPALQSVGLMGCVAAKETSSEQWQRLRESAACQALRERGVHVHL
jgi:Ran GTPase-activating protein (RanGAP) involved in mRNA processing and transport